MMLISRGRERFLLLAALSLACPILRCVGQAPATAGSDNTLTPVQPVNAALTAALAEQQRKGQDLTTASDLSGSVTVEAVLLPPNVVKPIFGGEVAKNYAVISIIISNNDVKQSAVIHSAFLDYSHWLFSGVFAGLPGDDSLNIDTKLQTPNKASQVASAEVRTVRTDFQDAQLRSPRAWVIHIATAIGASAASVTYATANDLFAPSVAAFNGVVVPAISAVWPDPSQNQLNLLNDVGFRTNKVIGAKQSDIIVTFFPLGRFLTRSMEKLYRKSPAAFFNPSEELMTKKMDPEFKDMLEQLGKTGLLCSAQVSRDDNGKDKLARKQTAGANECSMNWEAVRTELLHALGEYERYYVLAKATAQPNRPVQVCAREDDKVQQACAAVSLMGRMSLNTIRVVVGGTMTLDVATIPAAISGVTLTGENDASNWKAGKTLSGTVNGTFLSAAALTVTAGTDASGAKLTALPVVNAAALGTSATDSALPFTLTTSADIAPDSKLTFVATKTAQDKSVTASAPFTYAVTLNPTAKFSGAGTETWSAGQSNSMMISGSGLSGASVTQVSGKDSTGAPLAGLTYANQAATGVGSINFTVTVPATPSTGIPKGRTLTFTLSTKGASGLAVTVQYVTPKT
jgi:hypothetical protein